MEKCGTPIKPGDPFYQQFYSADGFNNAAGYSGCGPGQTQLPSGLCIKSHNTSALFRGPSADGFNNAAGYKVGDRIGNECYCSNGVWADECCKKGAIRTQGGGFSNIVGPLGLGSGCGARPIGIGKNHKAKLDAWNKCMDQARIREQQKKQVKIDAKQAAAMSDAALAGAFTAPPPQTLPDAGARTDSNGNPLPSTGLSMGVKIAIGAAIGLVVIGGIFVMVGVMKKKKKAGSGDKK